MVRPKTGRSVLGRRAPRWTSPTEEGFVSVSAGIHPRAASRWNARQAETTSDPKRGKPASGSSRNRRDLWIGKEHDSGWADVT